VKRREFIALLGGASIASPLAASAQQPKSLRRVGVLMGFVEGQPEAQIRIANFRARLNQLSWLEGRNIQFDYRWAGHEPDRMQTYATELVSIAPDVIVSSGTPPTKALQRTTNNIPIVFANVADPLGTGLVTTLASPGGNITGFTNYEYAIGGKWLELLHEIAPDATRVAVSENPSNASFAGFMREIEAAAQRLRIQVVAAQMRDAAEIESSVNTLATETNAGMLLLPDGTTIGNSDLIVALAAQYRIPAIYSDRVFVTKQGLMSYAYDANAQFGQAAFYVDRILKGTKPSDLPVQAPTKYELIINLKTAKALGLTIPPSLLATADEVIE
jgi:putative tryptophan/tyrosine transport system substrate-binding protein